ncbi:hypothetical protein KIH39_25200 [Telmatocola sphagniphila]|jgi:hypothetical protein|uniref:Uncharacterized protein n=1 Tax=Telmatocola sphagniphila TaxID=1123043 RepID=A0A8E6EXX7_9BACT|nr:hypothetical protein [Telmatocola sphagniphila]QVL32093.1 hypothetical protein KIH39_25200 [Telmatocola sphagniphila]
MKDSIAKMKELTAALHNITDEKSSQAAVSRIDSIVADVNKLQDQMKAMAKPSPEEDKALQAKYEKDLKEALNGLMGEVLRVSMNPTLMNPIKASMEKMKRQ